MSKERFALEGLDIITAQGAKRFWRVWLTAAEASAAAEAKIGDFVAEVDWSAWICACFQGICLMANAMSEVSAQGLFSRDSPEDNLHVLVLAV